MQFNLTVRLKVTNITVEINFKKHKMKTKTTYYECVHKGINMLCYKVHEKYYLLGNHAERIEVKDEIGKKLTEKQLLKQINLKSN